MIGAIIAKRKVSAGFDSINRRDVSAFLTDWREDAAFIYPGNMSVSGKIEGKEAIEKWFRRFLEQFPKVNITVKNAYVKNLFALGATNDVAVEWDISLTNREGKDFQNSGITTISIRNGKAVLARDYYFDVDLQKESWGE